MELKWIYSLLIISFCWPVTTTGQQISYANPSGLTVCDSSFLSVEIYNDSTLSLGNAVLMISLANCLEYLPGSVSGAQESSVSNLNQPEFLLPLIPPGGSAVVQTGIRAPCNCFSAINSGTPFSNAIHLLAWNDTTTVLSTAFVVETPQLVITQVTNSFLSGGQGDLLTRTFTIQNTRPGPLTDFLFEDFFQAGGMEINISQGVVETNLPGHLAVRLTGSDFQSVGDGDILFEQGESITLTESVLVTYCGLGNPSSLSQIVASWGCGGLTCQSVQQTALVQFLSTTLQADLQITPLIQAPTCFCAYEEMEQGLTIVNLGNEPAFGPEFSIRQDQEGTGIDPASVSGLINGNPVTLNTSSSQQVLFTPPCANPGAYQEKLQIQTPDLAPGDTLVLKWNTYFCNPDCSQSENLWIYEYRFGKSCPPNAFIQSDTFQASLQHPELTGLLTGDFQTTDGETTTFTYTLQYDSLHLLQEGQVLISMTLPCGITWEDNDMILSGVEPGELIVQPVDSLTLVTAFYPLPLPGPAASLSFDLTFFCDSLCQQEFICADSVVTSCPEPECAEEAGPRLFLDIQSTLLTCSDQPAFCGIQTCDTYSFEFSCEPDSICFDTIAGYVYFDMDLYRLNLGLPDNDNDRWPDGPAFQDPSLLRLDRSMPGDTIETVLAGVVIADHPDISFPFSSAALSFQPLGADPVINSGLYDPEGIKALDAVLEIWDASEGTSYTCPNLSFWGETTSDRLIYHYGIQPDSLTMSGCALPQGFAWEGGDSLRLTARHKLNVNPVKQSSAAPSPPIFQVTVRPILAIGETTEEVAEGPFQCGCADATWEITGYEYQLLPGVYAIPFCDTSEFQGSTFYKLELGQGNFFPYEYRPLGSAPLLTLEIPQEITMMEAQVKQFTLQQGPSWKGVTPVAGLFENGLWSFDLSPCQDTLADEGFYFLFQYRFTADCTAEGALSMTVRVQTDFAPGLLSPYDTLWVDAGENALKILLPTLQLFNPLPNQLALDNKGRWNFTLTNLPNSVSGQQSGTAPHIWLTATSASGLLTGFELIDTQTGQAIPDMNGIFQLDSLTAGQSRALQLVALNESCQQETVEVSYGFGCDPYDGAGETPCQEDIQYWQVLAPPGGVDAELSGPADCAQLCDTVPYHTITVYNTNLGPVCDPFVEITLPQGLYLTPGSSALAYPAGGTFVPVSDPVFLGNSTYRWNLSDLSPALAANCLPGLGADPGHQVSLRFLTETDCSFPVNSSILFRAGGQRNCGDPVNVVTRPGNPVCIELEGDDVQTFFQSGLEEDISCQDTEMFNLALVHSAPSQLTDTISLLLPPGVTYVPGSMIPVANAPAAEPLTDTIDNRIELNWALPPGLNPFTLIAFRLSLSGFSSLPCGEEYFWLSAGIQSQAVCVTTGDTCSVRVETGTEYLPFTIQRPELSISAFQASWQAGADSLFASVVVENSGSVLAAGLNIDIYWDMDGDGQGDSLLLSAPITLTGQTDSLSFSLPATIDQACGLIAVIDSTMHCVCAFASLPISQPLRFHEIQEVSACSGTPTGIGFCLPDWSAEWSASPYLSCDTCCSTSFFAINHTDSLLYFTVDEILESAAGCALSIPYEISLRPEPGIGYVDPVVCAGEGVNLLAEPGLAHLWEGPGLAPVAQQGLTIFPEMTGTYILSMTDLQGCMGMDSVTVEVFALPFADAGADTLFCPDEVFQLQAYPDPLYEYAWSPELVFDDPSLPDPVFLIPQEGSYVLEVTDEKGCRSWDTIQVSFGETPLLQLPPDTLICAGDTVVIVLSGNFSSLEWDPAGAVQCLSPLCDSVAIAPLSSIQVSVVAYNDDLCAASGQIHFEVADESSFQVDTIFTCANEPVWIGGTWVSEAGFYCDTLVLPSGCRQIFCTELQVGDTVLQVIKETVCPGTELEAGGQTFSAPGIYEIPLSTWEGCDSTLTLDLEWHALPELAILPADSTIFEGESAEILVTGPGTSFLWSPSASLDCDTCARVLATPQETTLYQVWVTDENGCVQLLSSAIQVRIDCDPGRIQIPDAFTPDGDGVNDTFGILTKAGKEVVGEMKIWNRWGQLVFSSANPQARWDGNFGNEPAQSDAYAYLIEVRCPDGLARVYSGSVTLIR